MLPVSPEPPIGSTTRWDEVIEASGAILDLLPVATVVCDLNQHIIRYNRAAVELWGRSPKPGETFDEFAATSNFYGPDGSRLPNSRLHLHQVLTTGIPVRNEEVDVERPNGRRTSVLVNINPLFDAEHRLTGAVACIQDVTERKRVYEELTRSRQDLRQQEQRWNATYEHAAIGIVELDRDGRFLRVNGAICGITGLSREELLGWRLFARTHPDDRKEDEELYRRQVNGELNFYSVEKRFLRKDGRVVWCAIRSSTVHDADGNFLYSVRVVQDVTERKEAELRQRLWIDELNHRVKNTLAIVQSLAAQTAQATNPPEAFRQSFEGRLLALANAHDQLARRHWRSADLRDIVAGAVAPYFNSTQPRIATAGEPVILPSRASVTLALAFHELATNAAKHGALSRPTGRIEVFWNIEHSQSRRMLRIEWCEREGPPVVEPTRQGFGSRFIERAVAAELSGTARLIFDPDGLRCAMEIPLDERIATEPPIVEVPPAA